MRNSVVGAVIVGFGLFVACSDDSSNDDGGDGEPTGGTSAETGGAGANTGGTSVSSGGSPTSGGSLSTGGSANTGGADPSTGGGANAGGASPSSGGSANAGGASPSTGGASAPEAGSAGSGEAGDGSVPVGLSWPIDCIPEETCAGIGFPDTDDDGVAHDCDEPGYRGHQGTDIGIPLQAQFDGTSVRAAADGEVLFAFDGKYDQCPNDDEPDCQPPASVEAGSTSGTTVCTPLGDYCGTGQPGCFWCFAGGNVIVIRHHGVPGVFATRYDHLRKDSVLVQPGDRVTRGQKIAEAASAGNSTGPHLHFEVWGTGFYELADPWAGECGPNTGPSLWAHDPPWSG